jgi:iron(III) transport system substrate-binding protein
VFYTGAVASPFHKEIGATFEKKYGIKFEVLEARASELRERISTEQAAGRFLGDVHHNGSTSTSLMIKDGNLQQVGRIPNTKNLTPPFTADEYRVPSYVLTYGILLNKDQVGERDEPKSWKDLLDARWQGKILSDDMRALGGGSVFFMVMYDTFGRAFHEQLATQRPVFTRDMRNAERRVAQGEYSIYIPQLLTFYSLLKPGLPLKFVIPKEGTPYIRYDMSMLKNAPHPNAARLFMNFMLEQESQLVFANGGVKPVVNDVIEQANPALRELLNAPALGTTEVERQNEMLKLANEIYK